VRLALVLLVLGLAAGCGGGDGESDSISLEGVPWVLVSGVDLPQAGDASVTAVTTPTAAFVEGTVSGTTGCNRYNAPYTVEGDSLEIGLIASTLMACAAPAGDVEQAFTAALERVAAYEVADDELVLHDADHSEVLRFTAEATAGG
jgi:heat shock protein HslJ